jgi:hypothetical protein
MSDIWEKIYKKDVSFFGEEPSDFAVSCYGTMKDRVKTMLELGCDKGGVRKKGSAEDLLWFVVSVMCFDYLLA